MPFPDHSFDIVAAALVVNFISDVHRALGEMHRVGRPGGTVAAYVWDFGAGRAPNSSVAIALRQIGSSVPPMPGIKYSSLDALRAKFWRAGLESIEVNSFEVTITFSDFEDFWRGQIPSFSPLARIVATLPECDRMRLRRQLRGQWPAAADGSIACSARSQRGQSAHSARIGAKTSLTLNGCVAGLAHRRLTR